MQTTTDPTRRRITAAAALALAAITAPSAFGQAAWPGGRPISLVVGYPAGGSVDLVARIVAEPLGKRLRTPVVVENVAGAGGTIAAQKVVNAQPDGYSLLLGSGSEVSIARLFNSAVKYDGQVDLATIGLIGTTPMVFVASPVAGIKTMEEALARSRREPNRLTFASSGVGTPLHMSGELVNVLAGTTFRHVPYRGAAQQMQDLMGGQVDLSVSVLSSALPHIEAGKIVPLAVTTTSRARALPQVPSISELPKLKGYDMNVWFGLFGPAKLPPAVVARLNKELNEVLREQDVWQKLQKAGVTNEGGSPQQLAAFVQAETARVRTVVNKAIATGTTQ